MRLTFAVTGATVPPAARTARRRPGVATTSDGHVPSVGDGMGVLREDGLEHGARVDLAPRAMRS